MLKIEKGFYVCKKSQSQPLTTHFNSSEFACPCSHCDEQRISVDLVRYLDNVRTALGAPLRITSGYRCKAHQADLKARGYETAAGISQHELGSAADVQTVDLALMGQLLTELKKHFHAIGVSKRFVHVDMRSDKERRWAYAN